MRNLSLLAAVSLPLTAQQLKVQNHRITTVTPTAPGRAQDT
jgi:hypothetical protein